MCSWGDEATCPPCGHLALSHSPDGCAHPTCTCGSDPTGDTSIPLVGADLSRVADAVQVDPLDTDPHSWPAEVFAKGAPVSSGQVKSKVYDGEYIVRAGAVRGLGDRYRKPGH